MTYDQALEKARPAIRELLKLGRWDKIHVDLREGEPIVVAVLHRHPAHKFLLDFGIMKKPKVPARVQGILCEVRVHYPLRNVVK